MWRWSRVAPAVPRARTRVSLRRPASFPTVERITRIAAPARLVMPRSGVLTGRLAVRPPNGPQSEPIGAERGSAGGQRVSSDEPRMKRTERQHLKTNEVEEFVLEVTELVTAWKRELSWLASALAIVAVIGGGYWAWQQHQQGQAHAMLADALVVEEARVGPPAEATGTPGLTFPTERERAQAAIVKFKATADAYPSTDAGIFARYQQASLEVTIGNAAEAVKAYQAVIDRAGEGLYGEMARLGLAEAYARSGQFEQAFTAYKALAQQKDSRLPVDGILMELGRAYRDAGRTADAQQTFNQLVQEFPDSPYNADAKKELDALKKA
jgi:TolA-binding protein